MESNSFYCYTEWWEENYQWVVAASVLVPVLAIIGVFLYKMRGRFFYIGEKEILGDNYDLIRKGVISTGTFNDMSFTSTSSPGHLSSQPFMHPEAAIIAKRVAARSKFKNVEFDPNTNTWFVLDSSIQKMVRF